MVYSVKRSVPEVERLEKRLVPSTIAWTQLNGVDMLTYAADTANPGVANNVTLTLLTGGRLQIADTGEASTSAPTGWNISPDGHSADGPMPATEGIFVKTEYGNDTVDASAMTRQVVIWGGDGNDTAIGGSGNDTLDGGDGRGT